jgi:UDP-3-O-[3-hydroxymyristoyl] glucosamine N-acyltransferase
MLYNYNSTQPLYIAGSGPYAQDLKSWLSKEQCGHVEIIEHDRFGLIRPGSQVIIGFKDTDYRKNFLSKTKEFNYVWPTFVHSTAVVTSDLPITNGIVVSPLAVLCHDVLLNEFCVIGITAVIGHCTRIGFNTVINQGTIIGGSTKVGDHVYVGQKCSIKDKVNIHDNVFLSMNSVVTKNIDNPGQYVGNRPTIKSSSLNQV